MGIGNTVSEVTEYIEEVSTYYRKNINPVKSGKYWSVSSWRSDVPTETHYIMVIEYLEKTIIKPEFVGKVNVAINKIGILHRENGPAVREIDIRDDMVLREEYWIKGIQYSKQEFSNIMFVKKMETLGI